MNKKFLSAILFGALMVTSTGTFVSCKDYDDDIDNINKELTDIKSQLSALQTTVNNGDYVTGVAKTADGKGITFTFSKGNPVTVTLEETSAQQITFDKDGQLLVDNKATGIYPAKDADKAPVKIEGGYWYTLNDKGEYDNTNIPVSGLTVSGSETLGWTLNVIDAEGKAQTINIPTASTLMTEFELIGLIGGDEVEEGDIALSYHAGEVGAKWEGPKGTIAAGDYIVATAADQAALLVRMAPSSVDFTGASFNLVNSKGNSHPWLALNTAAAYDKVLVKAKAAQKAGLYTFTLAPTVVKAADYNKGDWKVNGTDVATQVLALQNAAGNFTSQFGITVKYNETEEMNAATVKLNGIAVSETAGNDGAADAPVEIDLNADNEITFDAPNAVYDSYIEYSNDDDVLFSIDHDNAAMTFKATQMPDNDTKTTFKVVVKYLNVSGTVSEQNIYVKVTKSLVEGVVYERTHKIVANNAVAPEKDKNFFTIDLKTMTDKMSATNLAVFNRNALVANTKFTVKDAEGEVVAGLENATATTMTAAGITPSFLDKDGKAVASEAKVAKATTVKFAIDNEEASGNFEANTPYTIEVVYAGTDKLADATIQLTLTLPALKDMFVPQDGIWVNDVASAYMDETANRGEGAEAKSATYTIKNAFKKLADTVGESTFDANLDAETKVVGDYTAADLASLSNVVEKDDIKKKETSSQVSAENIASWAITLTNNVDGKEGDDLNKNKTQIGYKQNLKVIISNVSYLGYWSYGDETYSFTLKVMSPILEGKVYAVGDEIVIPSADLDGFKIDDSNIKAHTYNKEVVYSIFADTTAPEADKALVRAGEGAATAWKRKEIMDVQFKSGNEELFTVPLNGTAYTPATGNAGEEAYVAPVFGSITITKVSGTSVAKEVTTNIKVTVFDAWGYKLDQEVPVKITVKE